MIDVNQKCLDAKGALYPSKRSGQRKRVATAGETDNNPIRRFESRVAGPSKHTLL